MNIELNGIKIEPYNTNDRYIDFNSDDSENILKEKVFISSNMVLHPETIMFYKKKSSINVISILDILSFGEILDNMNEFTNQKTKLFNELYSRLSKQFIKLSKNTLLYTVKYILYTNLPDMFSSFGRELEQFYKDTMELRQSLFVKYSLKRINISETKLKEFVELDKKTNPDYKIVSIIIVINFGIKTINVDLKKIIRKYPKMDNIFPLMYTFDSGDILTRLYDKFPKEKINEWIYKKKAGKDKNLVHKKPKGLIFKIYSNCQDMYFDASLSRNSPKINIKLNFDEALNTKFKSIDNCLDNVDDIVRNFQKIVGIDRDFPITKDISYLKYIFYIKKWTDLKLISKTIKLYFTDNISIEPDIKTVLKLRYSQSKYSTPITIIIRTHENIYNRNNKKVVSLSNSVSVIGATSENQISYVTLYIINIFVKTHSLFKIIKPLSIEKNIVNVKSFRKKGIPVNSSSCQRIRQPALISKDSKSNSPRILEYKGYSFNCSKDEYPYPGFTNDNIVCCFKKNQTNKPSYIRNIIKKGSITKVTDKNIIDKPIIVTSKILEQNRLGLLGVFETLFQKSFFRLGNVRNNSFINCFKLSLSKDFQDTDLKISKSLFRSLNNGELFNKITLDKYLLLIKKGGIDHTKAGDLLSKLFSVNIIIFEQDENAIRICESFIEPSYNDNIFMIFYRKINHYELVVHRKSSDKLVKNFKKEENFVNKIINEYNNLCYTTTMSYKSNVVIPKTIKQLPKNIKITGQVVNINNKISYVNSNYGIIPVAISGPVNNVKNVKLSDITIDAHKQYKLTSELSSFITVIGQIEDKKLTIGLVTSSGFIIPTNPSKIINELPFLNQQFFYDADNALIESKLVKNEQYIYSTKIHFIRELYQRLRYTLSNIINSGTNSGTKQKIHEILDSENMYKNKLNLLEKIITSVLKEYVTLGSKKYNYTELPNKRIICGLSDDPFCVKGKLYIVKDDYINLIHKIVYEIIGYTKKGENILNGKVEKVFLDKNNFIKTSDEKVFRI
jgi:hypothetical protein